MARGAKFLKDTGEHLCWMMNKDFNAGEHEDSTIDMVEDVLKSGSAVVTKKLCLR